MFSIIFGPFLIALGIITLHSGFYLSSRWCFGTTKVLKGPAVFLFSVSIIFTGAILLLSLFIDSLNYLLLISSSISIILACYISLAPTKSGWGVSAKHVDIKDLYVRFRKKK